MSRLLQSGVALGGAVFVVLASYASGHGLDTAEQTAYASDLRRVQAVNAELNECVLESSSALMTQYDPMVARTRDLKRLFENIARVPAGLGSQAARDIRAEIHTSETQLQQKDELIETFKTHNSVLQNSLRYFPILANSVIGKANARPGGSNLASTIQGLVGAIMLFDTSVDAESTARVIAAEHALSDLTTEAKALNLDRETSLVLAHCRLILDRKPLADEVVKQILSVPLARSAQALEEVYSMHAKAALRRAALLKQVLFVVALSTIVLGLSEVILRIRRSAKALEQVTFELRKANAALAHEREKERLLGERKTRFVSMTSHEFRTPLSVIVSSTELLERYAKSWDSERRIDHLERIRDAARCMWRMLDDLLLIGRAEAGMLVPSPRELNLDAFCRKLIDSAERSCGRQSAVLYDFSGPALAHLDERLLSEVLGNLLGNALKYSARSDDVLFQVSTSDESCRFLVEDAGVGIPEEDMPRLFESFFRSSNVKQIGGSGLGLAVVKKALDVQRGTIEVDSELGLGTTFVVNVPRDQRSCSTGEGGP